MKKILVVLIVACLLAGLWWAWDRHVMTLSPRDSYARTVNSARLGDEDAFLDGFTAESRPLMQALLALSRNYPFVQEDPYRKLVHADVIDVQVDGDRAELLVQDRNRELTIPLVLEEGAWRVDAFALEEALGKRR